MQIIFYQFLLNWDHFRSYQSFFSTVELSRSPVLEFIFDVGHILKETLALNLGLNIAYSISYDYRLKFID